RHQIAAAIRITSPNGIASLESIQLGGVRQWIQIRGQDRTHPLLLVIHGGPGLPDMPQAYVNAALEKDFVVVQWDQRGAGKSFRSDMPGMNLEQFVSDAHDLVVRLRERFQQPQIFLVAHSSGSVIALRLLAQDPQMFRAYVGISQAIDLAESERILYQFAVDSAAQNHDEEATKELNKIGPPPWSSESQLQISQKWVNHFAPDKFGALSPARLRLAFCSPAYSLLDLVRFVRGAKFSFDHLWPQLFALNLKTEVPRLDVPVYFFVGRDDHVVTAQVQEEYFQALDAPRGKELIWFEHSAHWPQLEEPEKFAREMSGRVLRENPAAATAK
ncbi:MAG: alpha/beta hydrolase, partial [Verrucomicrobiota bacterium]|nr:alpha/beta hydrolase [Verrucomicrobiota bacterium]